MAKKAGMKVVRATGEKMLAEHLEDLDVGLLPDELLHRGNELARLEDDQRKLDDELETVKAGFKKRQNEIDEKRSHLSRVIRDKKEKRSVKVQDWAFFDKGRFESHRADNGEVIYERALLAAEMQETLDLGGEAEV